MSQREGKYARIEERFEAGDRSMLMVPLDYLLLESLPPEGTNVGGFYQVGETAQALAKRMKPLTPSQISTRLRIMFVMSLVVKVKMVGTSGSNAWQTTKKGKEELERWSQSQT